MKPISDRYERLFREFYADKARDRFDFVIAYSLQFVECLPFKDKVDCKIDRISVDAFITSYFLDVIKFKEYHFREKTGLEFVDAVPNFKDRETTQSEYVMHRKKMLNSNKVGAFTAKWLLKYRAISILPREGESLDLFERRHVQNAPFWLAANISLRSMDIEPTNVPERLYRNLIYHLRFREFDDRSMMLYFELLSEFVELSGTAKG